MTRNSGPFPTVHWGPKKSSRKRGPARKPRPEHPQDLAVPDGYGATGSILPPRENRPAWTMNTKDMMRRCVGPGPMRRFTIAEMYWCQGKTAGEIADKLSIPRNSVKSIINRLRNRAA